MLWTLQKDFLKPEQEVCICLLPLWALEYSLGEAMSLPVFLWKLDVMLFLRSQNAFKGRNVNYGFPKETKSGGFFFLFFGLSGLF